LGEAVTDYMSGHADDVPQEDRWRTLFSRKLTVHFEELRRQGEEANEKLDDRIDDIERSMAAIVRKLGVKVDADKQGALSRRLTVKRRLSVRGAQADGRSKGAGPNASSSIADAAMALSSAAHGVSGRFESTTRGSVKAKPGSNKPERSQSLISTGERHKSIVSDHV